MSYDRKYIDYYWTDLDIIFRKNSDNLTVLKDLMHEFSLRNRRGAKKLREKVETRFSDLLLEQFKWPQTNVIKGRKSLEDVDWYEYGMLGVLGYHVGKKGLQQKDRWLILETVYFFDLPKINGETYHVEWGKPKTGKRLKKMANSIATFAKQAKKNSEKDYSIAINQWEDDLRYLKKTYYTGKYNFIWPR
ncbi:MAG: hypothetical protein R3D00_25260 [Bacteroidia bacterium]